MLLIDVVAIGYKTLLQVTSRVASVNSEAHTSVAANHDDEPSIDDVVATGVAANLASRANQLSSGPVIQTIAARGMPTNSAL